VNIPLPPRTSEEGFLYVLDEVILPILAKFKPDLIVNSAGQDNHYTDPITNMCFSAQGYAELTRRLRPDIAVLEGGYSIEGALPYVNVGIIMALAGMDYSKVKEPDYQPEKIRQSPDTTAYIQKLTEVILENWSKSADLREKHQASLKFAKRERNIFYDTDQIQESQRENLRVCPDCSGVLAIDSDTDRGRQIYAVHIPRKACKACQELGYQWYEGFEGKHYDGVFLQDRVHNQYLVRERKR
jgi:hypothetical protein